MKSILFGVRILETISVKKIVTILIAMFVADVMFLYLYGNLVPAKRIQAVNHVLDRTITVEFSEGSCLKQEDLSILDEYSIQDVWAEHISDIPIPLYETFLTIQSFRENNAKQEIVFCDLFKQEELNGNNIIVSSIYPGETLEFDGHQYHIIKKVDFLAGELAFIPINSFLSNKLTADSIHYVLKNIPSSAQKREIVERLNRNFSKNISISLPNDPWDNIVIFAEQKDMLILLHVVAFLTLLLYFYLIVFFTRLVAESYPVYQLVGCSAKKFSLTVLAELLLFHCFVSTAAVLFHSCAYWIFDEGMNLYRGVHYLPIEYLSIGIVIAITLLIVSQIFLSYNLRRRNEL